MSNYLVFSETRKQFVVISAKSYRAARKAVR